VTWEQRLERERQAARADCWLGALVREANASSLGLITINPLGQ
jgi:hypothetical protein